MNADIENCESQMSSDRSSQKIPMRNEKEESKLRFSKRKLSLSEKPRKIHKSSAGGTRCPRRNDAVDISCNGDEQNSPDNLSMRALLGARTAMVDAVADDDVNGPVGVCKRKIEQNGEGSESEEFPIGPQAFGLMPVHNSSRQHESSSGALDCHCTCHSELEKKFLRLEKQFTTLQNKHDLLQESHEKLSQLVEAQNHLLACHAAPPPSRKAMSNFSSQENKFISYPDRLPEPEADPTTPPVTSTPRLFSEAPDLPPNSSFETEQQFYTLPRRATARDIIRLWEEGSRVLPPVKNWSPAQKMKVQSKLSRWKKIIDILKTECNDDMALFEEKYSGENGDLLPVTTILALHENQLSSQFLSKGFSNVKQNTIDIKTPVDGTNESENRMRDDVLVRDDGEESTVPDDETTNRYVLPRKVTARDVVHLWDNGCDDFPAIATWSKAQKIGQETKIFRWKKIVDVFKTDCNSNWDVFQERYSNENGELLPLATILAKHEAMYANDQLPSETFPSMAGIPHDATRDTSTVSEPLKADKSSHESDSVILPRKVTAFEVVRYWTEGCDTFGPVKDWTRAQKMGQETKISRWKKIYEIFRYQCCRDWDEFCRRYTNQRGELLPIATILAKYEAENPSGAPSYQIHEKVLHENAARGFASQVIGEECNANFADTSWTLPQVVGVEINVNDAGQFVLPAKLTAVEALSLWENGTEQVPPMKNWAERQTPQCLLLDNLRRLADIYERDCGGQFRRFLDRFSDTDGELLPISGIIYSSHCQKYSPYFTEYEKNAKYSRSRGEQYELPKRVGAKEIVWLWDHGCRDFPPVKTWSSAQKLRYTTKLSRWRKIADIFHEKCNSNWRTYEEKYSNGSGELLALSTVISMQDETDSESYASMIKRPIGSPEASPDSWQVTGTPCEGSPSPHNDVNHNDDEDTPSQRGKEAKLDFDLPKKVNALDIINFWERGFGDMPPVAKWTPLQRFRQRSKISRWSKIYDIFRNQCRGSMEEFEKRYSDQKGQLLPASTIISMYESRIDPDQYSQNDTLPKGPVVRKYVLPRKVDAKDIVSLWEEGNENFPPIASWTKADKIGQETKIFRWKKIVDIFRNHCDGDWEYFEDLFSNEFGHLLPTSAIIAKFETSFLKR